MERIQQKSACLQDPTMLIEMYLGIKNLQNNRTVFPHSRGVWFCVRCGVAFAVAGEALAGRVGRRILLSITNVI
jgi:hypothetical protein